MSDTSLVADSLVISCSLPCIYLHSDSLLHSNRLPFSFIAFGSATRVSQIPFPCSGRLILPLAVAIAAGIGARSFRNINMFLYLFSKIVTLMTSVSVASEGSVSMTFIRLREHDLQKAP
jgi:hypothetical protein